MVKENTNKDRNYKQNRAAAAIMSDFRMNTILLAVIIILIFQLRLNVGSAGIEKLNR